MFGTASDIYDITRASIELEKYKKRAGTNNPCTDKEIRDNIADVNFSIVSTACDFIPEPVSSTACVAF